MAKASRPGNQAVAGIAGTSTTSPTFYKSEAAGSAAGNYGKSSSSGAGSSSNKSSISTSVTNSYSSSTKTSTGNNAGSADWPEQVETPYSDKFYAALAAGVPNGINASEFIAKDKAADAAKGVVAGAKANIVPGNVAPIDYVDIAQQKAELAARENQEKGRAVLAADYAVAQGV